MALVEDALKVLTDPTTPSSFGAGGMRAVDPDRVIAELSEQGASELDARAAGLEALEQVGGKVSRTMHTGGVGGGRSRSEPAEAWLVPAKALRR